ncbi:AfsR/SARP family transcriptional regulator [Terrabacter terrigena]|uniref:BTAD domain-containing putative transcriptional regulator n=1 Tax=Terrabacter terrigena TaxID=574718 RepID=A0ABW3MRU1_9MICO
MGGISMKDVVGVPMVRLCGGLVVGHGPGALGPRDLGGAKARHVLLALLLEGGDPVSKGRIIEYLWGDTPPAGALGTLEAYVSLLRKRLAGAPGTEGAAVGVAPIVTVPGGYRWDMSSLSVDVIEFARLTARAQELAGEPQAAVAVYARALALVARPLVPDEADLPWLQEAVQAHEARVLRALADGARAALEAGDLSRAQGWARDAIERDRLLESAWLVLLETLERRGEHADAVREYETCRTVFAAELGCDPGPRLRAVFRRLLAATSEQDDRLRDLVAAVVRLHHVLDTSTSQRQTAAQSDEQRSAPTEPGALQEDCSRLMALIRAADARARALAGQATAMAATATG